MTGTIWTPEFTRFYLGGAELFFGIIWLLGASYLRDQSRNFKREMKDPAFGERFRAVLARRKTLENLTPMPWRVGGGLAMALGLSTLARVMLPIVSYALCFLVIGVVMAVTFLRMRNRGERRAASLTPRTPNRAIPMWVYVLAALIVLAPLTFIAEPGLGLPSIVVSLVGCILIATASAVSSNMATILTGEDPEIELIVEERVRQGRMRALMVLATGSAFVFMTIAQSSLHSLVEVLASGFVSFANAAIFVWFAMWLYNRPKPRMPSVHVV